MREQPLSTHIAGVDLMWGDAFFVAAVGPLTMPPKDRLVSALALLADRSEMTRVGWVRSGSRWSATPDPARFVQDAVSELNVSSADDPMRVATELLRSEASGRPFLFYLGSDVLFLKIAHVLADGYTMTRLLAAVFSILDTGTLPAWTTGTPLHAAAARADLAYFGRAPAKVGALLRRGFQRPSGRAASSGTPVVPPQAWLPSVTGRFRTLGPAGRRELQDWRKAHLPGMSLVALLFAATERAVAACGIRTAGPPLVLFDARRHLAGRKDDVTGNFCAGLRMDRCDPCDPASLGDDMREATATGRSLAVLTKAAVEARLRRIDLSPGQCDDGAGWDMAYTYMGRPVGSARLPWAAGSRRPFYFGILTPAGPNSVTVGFTEIKDTIDIFASFHDNVIDADTVDRVIELVASDPTALLNASHPQAAGRHERTTL